MFFYHWKKQTLLLNCSVHGFMEGDKLIYLCWWFFWYNFPDCNNHIHLFFFIITKSSKYLTFIVLKKNILESCKMPKSQKQLPTWLYTVFLFIWKDSKLFTLNSSWCGSLYSNCTQLISRCIVLLAIGELSRCEGLMSCWMLVKTAEACWVSTAETWCHLLWQHLPNKFSGL